jgi:hypothetical protein
MVGILRNFRSSLATGPKSVIYACRPVPLEGRLAIVTDAGRDAVDAGSVGRAKRRADERRWCGRRSRVVLTPRRWRQVGGSDIRRRRWQTSPVTGESAKETVKTIARGMPGDSGVTVVTMLVCFFIFAHKAAGAIRAPGIPCALCSSGGGKFRHNSRENARRDRGRIPRRHCEERKRRSNPFLLFAAQWIASLTLAMTVVIARAV